MTSGERMVWAAEFTRMMAPYQPSAEQPLIAAIRRASALVEELHVLERANLRDGERAMLDDMLGMPR